MAWNRTTRTIAGLGTIALITLSGCSTGDTQEDSTSPTSTAPHAESSASSTGAYEPATAEHPARNVPKPVMPKKAKEESFEGAQAFMKYFEDCYNYMIQTGDGSLLKHLINDDNTAYQKTIQKFEDVYKNKEWISNLKVKYSVDSNGAFVKDGASNYFPLVRQSRSEGVVFSKSGRIQKIPSASYNEQAQTLKLKYSSARWKFVGVQDIQGIDYGDR